MNFNPMYSKNTFNLFPKDIQRHRYAKHIVYFLITALILVNIGFAFKTVLTKNHITNINKIKEDNLKEIENAKPRVELNNTIREYQSNLNKITEFQKSLTSVDVPMFDIFKEIEKKSPKNISMNSITLSEDGKIALTGLAKDEFVVCNFVSNLKKIDKLTDTNLKSVTKKEDEKNKTGIYVNIFNIDSQVKGITKEGDTKKSDPKESEKK